MKYYMKDGLTIPSLLSYYHRGEKDKRKLYQKWSIPALFYLTFWSLPNILIQMTPRGKSY